MAEPRVHLMEGEQLPLDRDEVASHQSRYQAGSYWPSYGFCMLPLV